MKHKIFNKTRLALTVSMVLGTTVALPAFAEVAAKPDDKTEVIEVTGIRNSLVKSMDIKRLNHGVVDAISAEEMGKFPDTNLAESLQRITGVAISRRNGEGSQITVRGFGPDFNLITLNGRQMPGTGNKRSYSLENISPNGVSELTVMKTSRAELPSGGLGATVNIKTVRPFDSEGLNFSITGKSLVDTSNEKGSDVTPEISFLLTDTFSDERFGVGFNYSYQERDWQEQAAGIGGWKADLGFGNATGDNAIDRRSGGCNVVNDTLPADNLDRIAGCHHYSPQGFGNTIRDAQRERTNAQLTLQFSPIDSFVATLDYTYNKSQTANKSMSFGQWFNAGAGLNSYEIDENGTVIKFNETGGDFSLLGRKNTDLVEAKSIGLNLDWQATETLHFSLDYHDSTNSFDPGADKGSGSSPFLIFGLNNLVSKTYDFTSGDIPQQTNYWPDRSIEGDVNEIDFTFGRFDTSYGEAGVEQLQLHGEWFNENDSALVNIKFGLARTEQEIGGWGAGVAQQGPNSYSGHQDVFPASMFTLRNTGNFLDQFSGGGNNLATNYYYDYDFDEALTRVTNYFDYMETNPLAGTTPGRDSEGTVFEKTNSAYVQAAFYLEVSEMDIDINIGVRYEETEVTSSVQQTIEDRIVWLSSTEWALQYQAGDHTLLETYGDYSMWLPSIDIKAEVVDDVIFRVSYGKTMTRAPLGNLAGIRFLSPNPKIGARTGNSGNTNLKPYSSVNLDLSLEYYYGEGSYVSLGYFKKNVDDWVEASRSSVYVDGLNDPYKGPRADQARSELAAEGIQATHQAIFDRIVANGGGTLNEQTGGYNIIQNANDPTLEWSVNQPVNAGKRSVNGVEFAIQHLFGESGFGAAFNATFVDGDVEFDPRSHEGQAVLPGLSDGANFQMFYEKYGISAKITYNWRDSYLIGVGQDQGSAEGPPQFFKQYSTIDASVNYDITDQFTVFIEGVNITNSTEEVYGRYKEQFLRASQYGARYAMGVRYTF
ncbi:MAG: TonB-dependent receptor [Alteromonadaceae bacterium]|nr:TonB-dependent receptor [Alteromonadaceae bacterium]